MLFNTPEYFLFLGVVLLIYYSTTSRVQNYMLLAASYLFYSFWDWRYLSLILLSTIVDFSVAQAIGHTSQPGRRKLWLGLSLSVNLGILGFFKYCNFFIHNAAAALTWLGFDPHLPVLNILLPVGISFYTFQTMSYTIEVYRGKMEPARNLADFALYICYFPQLVAGPIERPQNLLPALQNKRTVNGEQFISGCLLILIGLFRKIVIADGLSAQIDPIFASPALFSSPELFMGVFLFALQIYCDFAGYSDIARGSSRLLGIELMENFNQPYFAANVSEFWQRWHISLSSWLRDYVYIPLGGNRHGAFNTYRNLLLTMLLGGLWHGAAWTFVAWGALHGLYLIGIRLMGHIWPFQQQAADGQFSGQRLLGMAITFPLIMLTWVFFRAPGLSASIEFIRHAAELRQMGMWATVWPAMLAPLLLVLLIDIPQFWGRSHTVLLQWPRPLRDAVVALLLFVILLGVGTRAPFIYFQF